MLPAAHARVLDRALDTLDPLGVVWAVSGSVALRLHGVAVSCGDVDLVTSARDAPVVAAALPGTVVEAVAPRTRGALRGCFGLVEVDGVAVEVLGDVQNRDARGAWTRPADLGSRRGWVGVGGRPCPVLALEDLRGAYEVMGRTATVRAIDAVLRRP